MKEFAGALRERVEWWRPTALRDALGSAGDGGDDWTLAGMLWAAAEPIGHGPEVAGDSYAEAPRWRLTLRPCGIAVGDRIGRAGETLEVRAVTADPALPDRITVEGEVTR